MALLAAAAQCHICQHILQCDQIKIVSARWDEGDRILDPAQAVQTDVGRLSHAWVETPIQPSAVRAVTLIIFSPAPMLDHSVEAASGKR